MNRLRCLASMILCIVYSPGCTAQQTATGNLQTETRPIAFLGAEGFGKYSTGGRGGRVFIVDNLYDNGPGSLRDAVEAKGKKMVVFAVSGTIHLTTKLVIKADVTISGQTAPGDGICLADQPVMLGGDNIIIRYLRFRMGDKYQRGGMVDGNGGDDALGGTRRKNIMVDHCSVSWSTDELFSVYAGDSTTLQWNLLAEPLNYSYHFETGDKDYEHHGYGAIWGGKHSSFHHNLFAHCNSRTPRFDGIRNAPEENADFRNNVIYNWGHNNVYAGEGGTYNIINNYYKPGPDTKPEVKQRIANPWSKPPSIAFGKYYITGNYVLGSPASSTDNWKAVVIEKGTEENKAAAAAAKPFPVEEVITQDAEGAYELVLMHAGASYQRDTLDNRVIDDVRHGKGRFIDVQGGYAHGTPYEQTLSAWPFLKSLPAPADTDKDGIPDEWEKKNKLNPADANDGAAFTLHKQFTNLELYISSLVKTF
ncbi:MAG: pectate lyase [Chitinophagaceae bacterium]